MTRAEISAGYIEFLRKAGVLWRITEGAIATSIGLGCLLLAIEASLAFLLLAVPFCSWGVHRVIIKLRELDGKFTSAPGSARMGKRADLREAGVLRRTPQSVYCGMFKNRPAFYGGDRHIITVGASRKGKDTGLLVPNLMHLRRSIVVIDPKAELAAITARARAKMGKIIVINPFGLLGLGSAGYNPLAVPGFRTDSPSFFANAMSLGEALIKVEGKDPHWSRSAQSLAAAAIMRSKWFDQEKNFKASMSSVIAMLSAPYTHPDETRVTLQSVVREIGNHHYEPMARLVHRFATENHEVRSVIATALGQIAFLNDSALLADMEKHPTVDGKPFDFEMLKHQIITVYVVLPDDMLQTHAVWLRLIVAGALNALKRSGPGPIRPLLMLNEVGNLGRLEPLESGMGMAAGKGVTIWTVWQSLAQISKIYDQHGFEEFMSGAGVLNAFGAVDMETAKYLSERLGNRTEVVTSFNLTPGSKTHGKGESPSGFPLLHPEDIIAFKKRKLLSWIEPSSVAFTLDAPGYFDTEWADGTDPNPYFRENASKWAENSISSRRLSASPKRA